MSLLKTLLNDNGGFFIPYNRGTYSSSKESDLAVTKDYYTSSTGDFQLQKNGFHTAKGSSLYTSTAYNIGTSDFTVFFRLDIIERNTSYNYLFGANVSAPNVQVYLNNSTNQLRIRLGGIINSPTTVLDVNGKNIVAVVFDRDGTADFYLDGQYDSSLTISSESATDIDLYLGMLSAPNGVKHYEGLIKKALTARQIALLTSELNKYVPTLAWSKAIDGAEMIFDGVDDYVDFGIQNIAGLAGTDSFQVEFQLTTDTFSTAGGVISEYDTGVGRGWMIVGDSATPRFIVYYGKEDGSFKGTTTISCDAFTIGDEIKITINASGSDLVMELFQNGTSKGTATLSGQNLLYSNGANLTLGASNNGSTPTVSGIKNLKITNNDILVFHAPMKENPNENYVVDIVGGLHGSVYGYPYKSIFVQIPYKGELGIIANENTISSGFLENTGAEVMSGSFKVITEKNNSRIERVAECVTDGSLYFPQITSSVSGVNRYVDTGAGYVEVTSDLASAGTIPLTSGDKIILASENPKRSLYQEV